MINVESTIKNIFYFYIHYAKSYKLLYKFNNKLEM